jgi:hypothetical protein
MALWRLEDSTTTISRDLIRKALVARGDRNEIIKLWQFGTVSISQLYCDLIASYSSTYNSFILQYLTAKTLCVTPIPLTHSPIHQRVKITLWHIVSLRQSTPVSLPNCQLSCAILSIILCHFVNYFASHWYIATWHLLCCGAQDWYSRIGFA